jgi:molybdopterin synthase sulfur carrier subunit
LLVTRVKLQTFLQLKELLGHREIEVELPEGATVQDALEQMAALMGERAVPALLRGEDRSPQPYLRIMVNGRDIAFLGGVATPLLDADVVLVLPPAGGG